MLRVKNLIILFNIFLIILTVELFFKYVLDYRAISKTNTCKRIYNQKKDFSYYSSNCKNVFKHWEQDNFITYKTNSEGRRDLPYREGTQKKIAFIGDSFTFGAMVPIEDNYNFYAFKKILNSPYEIHNYGTSAEQLHNVINKLKNLDYNNYDYIIYGLTPNDFFDLVDGSYYFKINHLNEDKKPIILKKDRVKIFQSIKGYLLSTATSRFILHNLMANDLIYLKTYLSRKPYSGYLFDDLSNEWVNSINFFDENLKTLDKNLKSKLKIFILPQRAEVVSYRLKSYNFSFVNSLIKICEKNKIDCASSDLKSLSKIKESHFPVDGHLSIQGNHEVAKSLSLWVKNWVQY
tara:strand:+ start:591 stop:1634 length:1044 start_codon:yes stop_codon:yes gene_type:complete